MLEKKEVLPTTVRSSIRTLIGRKRSILGYPRSVQGSQEAGSSRYTLRTTLIDFWLPSRLPHAPLRSVKAPPSRAVKLRPASSSSVKSRPPGLRSFHSSMGLWRPLPRTTSSLTNDNSSSSILLPHCASLSNCLSLSILPPY